MGKNENSLLFILGMKSLTLLQERHHTAKGEDKGSNNKGNNETHGNVTDDETYYRTACRACGPIDVTTLKTQKFKGTL